MEAHEALLTTAKNYHQPIEQLLLRNGVLNLSDKPNEGLFIFLARTVVGQQLSNQAARTIWGRIIQLQIKESLPLEDLFLNGFDKELSSCGISRSKAKALSILSDYFSKRKLTDQLLDNSTYQEVSEFITSFWGLGQWSADMVAIFYLKMPDVWPEQDAALIRGLRRLLPGENPENVAIYYVPYRSYLARHIWFGLDNDFIR